MGGNFFKFFPPIINLISMRKEDLLKYMIDKKESIKNLHVFSRDTHFELTKSFIISIVGPRRSGKTYSLYDLIKNKLKLADEDFLFMDFEDAELTGINFKEILEAVNLHEEYYGKKPTYVFLDEIQNIENWSKSVRSLFETKRFFLLVSGSSSKLLSKEIATSLRGRALTYNMLPLSFKEFLRAKGIEIKKLYSTSEENQIKNYMRKYFKYGGFPDIVNEEKLATKFFNEYIDLVIFRDIVERHKVKNVFVIKFLIKNLISSFSKEFSVHKVFLTLKSQGIKVSKKTLYEYVTYLEDAYFSFFLKKFSYSSRKRNLSIPKVYINDVGIINSSIPSSSNNVGRIMENIVFLELKVREKEMYYWKESQHEVDFVVIGKGNKIEQLIQVCYDISDIDTKKREINALAKASSELKCKDLLIITYSQEGEEKVKGKKIRFIPLWKWLLS